MPLICFVEYKVNKFKLSRDEVLHKMKNWCAYQERSQNEVRSKLYSFILQSEEADDIIAELINENFLNEERFAIAFARGKFRIKLWGRNKIKIELKKHKISDYSIAKAVYGINDEDYKATLLKVIEKKVRLTKYPNPTKKFYGLLNYCVSRGYESDLVIEQLNVILKNI